MSFRPTIKIERTDQKMKYKNFKNLVWIIFLLLIILINSGTLKLSKNIEIAIVIFYLVFILIDLIKRLMSVKKEDRIIYSRIFYIFTSGICNF